MNDTDPVQLFLNPSEYQKLNSTERDQLALDRYLVRHKSNWEIGRIYERYLGYLYETNEWKVSFNCAIKGYDDFGRDLICIKGNKTEIVQAKCWSQAKVIHEKHVFQLFGTTIHYRIAHPEQKVSPVFISTTKLSNEAQEVADALKIRVEHRQLITDYPMIKCNVGSKTGEKIYHLPFDQQYDKILIGNISGELYVKTAIEAKALGFRRAWKYTGDGVQSNITHAKKKIRQT